MQGPPGAQRQEELEGTWDAIQIAQWLEVLGKTGRAELSVLPPGPVHPDPLCLLLWQVESAPRVICPCTCGCDLSWK